VTGSLLHRADLLFFLLFQYQLDELEYVDFWNTDEEIKEQYFMKMRSAVLELLQDGRRTERNVEPKTLNFVNFDYEVLKIITKQICIAVCNCWQIETLPARCSVRRPPS
jgi:hypothetical protein